VPAGDRVAGGAGRGDGDGDGRLVGERRVPVIAGRAWAFADGLRTADILPPRLHDAEPREAAAGLFADLDAGLAALIAPGDVLVAGLCLGSGRGGAAAARALAAAGIVAVVAGSFADGFDEALLAAGVPAFEVDAPAVFRTGDRLRLNAEAGTVANQSSGDRQPIRNLDDAALQRLRARVGR